MKSASPFKANWNEILGCLPFLLRPKSNILEVDRVESAIPRAWASRDMQIATVPPLDYVLQLDARGISAGQQQSKVPPLPFVSGRDLRKIRHRDPLAAAGELSPATFRGTTIDQIASAIGDIGLIVFGGMGARLDLVQSAFGSIATMRPALLFRLDETSPNPASLLAVLQDLQSYTPITAEELGLLAVDGHRSERLMAFVSSDYEKGALGTVCRAPQGLVRGDAKLSDCRRPFRRPKLLEQPSSAWKIGVKDLLVRGFSAIEASQDTTWRWSTISTTSLYIEVPAPGLYSIRVNIIYFVDDLTKITGLSVNGREYTFSRERDSIIFTTELYRHALIDVECAVRRASKEDSRALGFAITGVEISTSRN